MSAEVLREAAKLMRSRAEAVNDSPGEWEAVTHSDGRAWIALPGQERAWGMHGYPDHARHIASWGPSTSLAVADLLEAAGDLLARDWVRQEGHFESRTSVLGHTLAVARAYLGRDS